MDRAQANSAERRLRRENSAQSVLQAALIVAMVALLAPPLDPALPPPPSPSPSGVNADDAAAGRLTIPLVCCSGAFVAVVCLVIYTAINWIESASAEHVRDLLRINYMLILVNIGVRLLMVMQTSFMSVLAAAVINALCYATLHLSTVARAAADFFRRRGAKNNAPAPQEEQELGE